MKEKKTISNKTNSNANVLPIRTDENLEQEKREWITATKKKGNIIDEREGIANTSAWNRVFQNFPIGNKNKNEKVNERKKKQSKRRENISQFQQQTKWKQITNIHHAWIMSSWFEMWNWMWRVRSFRYPMTKYSQWWIWDRHNDWFIIVIDVS